MTSNWLIHFRQKSFENQLWSRWKSNKRKMVKQLCHPGGKYPPLLPSELRTIWINTGWATLRNQRQISIKCDSWCRQWRFYEDIPGPGHRLPLHVDIQWTMSVENNKTLLITYNNNNNSSHRVMLPNESFFLVFGSPFEHFKIKV